MQTNIRECLFDLYMAEKSFFSIKYIDYFKKKI